MCHRSKIDGFFSYGPITGTLASTVVYYFFSYANVMFVVDCDLCRKDYEGVRHCPTHSSAAVMEYYMVSIAVLLIRSISISDYVFDDKLN